MHYIEVEIVEWIDDYQPGIVACEIIDAAGSRHRFIDKLPLFTSESLSAETDFPRVGSLDCEILRKSTGPSGSTLIDIRTLESTEGQGEFTVLDSQICDTCE